MKEYYSRLYLKDGASLHQVKEAYRKLAKKFHPDKNNESPEYSEEFRQIHEAYEFLLNHLDPSRNRKGNSESPPGKYASEPYSQAGNPIVKSQARYAKAGQIPPDDTFYFFVIGFLIVLTILASLYAFYDLVLT